MFGVLLFAASACAFSEPEAYAIGPWTLGMSRDDVVAFEQFGPYTPVRVTGGIETAHGEFEGRPANISFGFDDAGLSYIQVWKYEGKDYAAAKAAALDVFALFGDRFDGAAMRDIDRKDGKKLDAGSVAAVLETVFGTAQKLGKKFAAENKVWATFILDMDPIKQPRNGKLHAQFSYSARYDTFYVFVFQDRPSAPSRAAKGNVRLDKMDPSGTPQ